MPVRGWTGVGRGVFISPNLDGGVDGDVGIGIEESGVVVGFSVVILAKSVSVSHVL